MSMNESISEAEAEALCPTCGNVGEYRVTMEALDGADVENGARMNADAYCETCDDIIPITPGIRKALLIVMSKLTPEGWEVSVS